MTDLSRMWIRDPDGRQVEARYKNLAREPISLWEPHRVPRMPRHPSQLPDTRAMLAQDRQLHPTLHLQHQFPPLRRNHSAGWVSFMLPPWVSFSLPVTGSTAGWVEGQQDHGG